MVGSAEIGTKTLNDAGLRAKYRRPEHAASTSAAGHHHPATCTPEEADRTTDDFKGLRIRFAAPTIRDFVAALAEHPSACRPNSSRCCRRHLDGVFIDYGGAGIAFKMGGTLKYSTEMYSYVSSFGVARTRTSTRSCPRPEEAGR